MPTPLRISVLSRMDPATPRTHSIAAIRLCAGLASQGHSVELVVPAVTKPSPPASELFGTYGVEQDVVLRYLSVGPANDHYGTRMMAALLARHAQAAARRNRPDVVISDDVRFVLPYVATARFGARGVVTAPWLHGFRAKRIERFVCAHSSCVLVTNRAILGDIEATGASKRPTYVTGNPVPEELIEFGREHSKAEARRRLGLDLDRPVVAYTGKLFAGMKELDYLLAAAGRLPEYLFIFTGGQPAAIAALEQRLKSDGATNVRLTGMLPRPQETRFYQKAANVLISYYSTEDHPYAYQQLPAKVAEYMASGNAIVTADFPAVRELLNPGNSWLVKPHDADALVDAVRLAVENTEEAAARGARAQRDIAARTSESVAAELTTFLSPALEGVGR
jgi:glycosyltransferase involved in cell wall biosynthesis